MGQVAAGSKEMCFSANNKDEEHNRLTGERGGLKEKFVSALDRSPFRCASKEDNGRALSPALMEDKDPWHQPAGAVDRRGKGPRGGPLRPAHPALPSHGPRDPGGHPGVDLESPLHFKETGRCRTGPAARRGATSEWG